MTSIKIWFSTNPHMLLIDISLDGKYLIKVICQRKGSKEKITITINSMKKKKIVILKMIRNKNRLQISRKENWLMG